MKESQFLNEGNATNITLSFCLSAQISISPNPAVLESAGFFDYEVGPTRQTMHLELVAIDVDNPLLRSSVSLTLLLEDRNDNAPSISGPSTPVLLAEDLSGAPEAGADGLVVVASVSAQDDDESRAFGSNSLVFYFEDETATPRGVTVDPESGEIKVDPVDNGIDFEETASFILQVGLS